MSRRPIARSADLSQLLADGYDISIKAGHLVAKGIPYVNAQRQVMSGTLITKLCLRNDVTIPPDDHTIFFAGEYPCDKNGNPIEGFRNSSDTVVIAEGLVAKYRDEEAKRQQEIKEALAANTPEGNLRAVDLTIEQMRDAGAHGADRSPQYASMMERLRATPLATKHLIAMS